MHGSRCTHNGLKVFIYFSLSRVLARICDLQTESNDIECQLIEFIGIPFISCSIYYSSEEVPEPQPVQQNEMIF